MPHEVDTIPFDLTEEMSTSADEIKKGLKYAKLYHDEVLAMPDIMRVYSDASARHGHMGIGMSCL